MSRRLVPLLALLACAAAVSPGAAQPTGGTESNLSLGVGSRDIALAGANLARVDDASALFWNPAGLGALERGDLQLMHASLGSGEATQTFLGLAYPTFGAGSLGIGWVRLASGDIDVYDAASTPGGTIGFAESAFLLTYAGRPHLGALGNAFSMGATAKVLTQSLGPWSATTGGLDLGLTWSPARANGLALAAVWQDALAPRPQLDRDADPIPSTLRVAGSYRLLRQSRAVFDLHVGADRVDTRGWRSRLGVECTYRGALRLRFGASQQGASFGVGLGWSRFALDYAYLSKDGVATHPVSLGARWGSSFRERQDARAATRERELGAALQAKLDARLANAQAAYDRGDYAAALEEWKVVAGMDPADEHAQRGLEAAGAKLAALQARSLQDQTAAAERAGQFALGLKYYAANEYALARNVWRDLLAHDAGNAEAARYLAKTEEELRHQVRQRADLARRYEANGDWVSALTAWTQVRLADSEHPEVEPALERCRVALVRRPGVPRPAAPGADPSRAESLYREALSYYSAGDLDHALPLLRELRELDPLNAAATELLTRTERQLQPLGPEDRARVRELYLRGMSYFTANQFESAIAEWTKIMALDPGNSSIYQNIEDARARMRALQK